jgi:hypothetical protein
LICVVAVLIKELNHAFMDFKSYATDLLNYVQLGGLASIVLTIIISWDPGSRIYSWLYPVASVNVLIKVYYQTPVCKESLQVSYICSLSEIVRYWNFVVSIIRSNWPISEACHICRYVRKGTG